MKKVITEVQGVVTPDGPYSLGVRKGNLFFISGQVGLDADGNVVGDIEAQAEQTFKSLKAVLEAGGASLDDVVKVTIYLTDMNDRDRVAKVRERYFKDNRPSSTLVEVSQLIKPDLKLEVEAIAVIKE